MREFDDEFRRGWKRAWNNAGVDFVTFDLCLHLVFPVLYLSNRSPCVNLFSLRDVEIFLLALRIRRVKTSAAATSTSTSGYHSLSHNIKGC
jgi:hypothetical protein